MPYPIFPDRYARPFAAAAFAAALAATSGAFPALARGAKAPPLPVEALMYSTMPSTFAHSPVMALDGDPNTFFESVYGMDDGDSFEVRLSQAIPVQSLQITTGDTDGDYLLSHARAEVSADDVHFTTAATFDAKGVAQANLKGQMVSEVRIVLDAGAGVPALAIREIALNSSVPISHVQRGPGRGEQEYGQFPELADWAKRAEAQMESFWPDTEAMLYTDKFIPPNLVHVIYKSGPNVTGVAATGGGVMTVNADYARQHPDDTALTVHEDTHVVQSYPNYNPVWLIEGIADYVRWVKFEPDQFPVQINPATATYHDSYRTSAAFLGWCCLHYDSGLVTKLNKAIRFNDFKLSMFKDYCGKDVDTLWAEFMADYKLHPTTILTPLVPAADQPRVLPAVAAGSSVPADLSSAFNAVGLSTVGAAIPAGGANGQPGANGANGVGGAGGIGGAGGAMAAGGGVDGEGNTFDAKLLGATLTSGGVTFTIGPAGKPDMITCSGQTVTLPSGQFATLWLLGTGVEGAQTGQAMTVTYTDGTTAALVQNFSDWYQPGRFPGEFHALAMPYRLGPDGQQDARPFNVYRYGFPLDATKTVQSLTLPNNADVKIFAVSVAK